MNTYSIKDSVIFFKVRERFGAFSNMSSAFPLVWEGRKVASSEALYQAHKFDPTIIIDGIRPFEIVLRERSPYKSKQKTSEYIEFIRKDWHQIKLDVMNYCIRLKYLQYQEYFDGLLDDTDNRPIVEKSRRDTTWGAVNDYHGNLVGWNLLGELWMLIREERPNVKLPAWIA